MDNRYSTIKISTDQQLKIDNEVKYLTDEQIKNGEQGIICVPWVIKEHTIESLKYYDSFMKKYEKQHKLCPKCGSKEYTTTYLFQTIFIIHNNPFNFNISSTFTQSTNGLLAIFVS